MSQAAALQRPWASPLAIALARCAFPVQRRLVRGDLRLDDGPAVSVQRTLRRRTKSVAAQRSVPLPADLVEALRGHCSSLLPAAPIWLRTPDEQTFYRDLERAGIERETPDGRLDIHALRVTYCTRLARAGVPLQVAQQLMGHSDPKLTASVYTRLGLRDAQAAGAALCLGRIGGQLAPLRVRFGSIMPDKVYRVLRPQRPEVPCEACGLGASGGTRTLTGGNPQRILKLGSAGCNRIS